MVVVVPVVTVAAVFEKQFFIYIISFRNMCMKKNKAD
jgi:hypothetical protein